MGDIVLRPTLFGGALKGEVDTGPTLTWLSTQALASTAANTGELNRRAQQISSQLGDLGWSIDDVTSSLRSLEQTIGLRLDAQTEILEGQAATLIQVRDVLMTPAKTRAAERVIDASQLLRKGRFERARVVSEEAIEADPNNPACFFLAAWSSAGLDDLDRARKMFEEAMAASDGDQRSMAARQAARVTCLLGDRDGAYAVVRDARAAVHTKLEAAAVAYDVAIYAWANDDIETAVEEMQRACEHDSRFCHMAAADVALVEAHDVREAARAVETRLAGQLSDLRTSVQRELRDLHSEMPVAPLFERPYASLGQGVRPPRDSYVSVRIAYEQYEAALELFNRSMSSPILQAAIADLELANRTIEEARGVFAVAGEDIATHVAAEQQQSELEHRRVEVVGQYEKAARSKRNAARIGTASKTKVGLVATLGTAAIASSLAENNSEAKASTFQSELAGIDQALQPGEVAVPSSDAEFAIACDELGARFVACRAWQREADEAMRDGRVDLEEPSRYSAVLQLIGLGRAEDAAQQVDRWELIADASDPNFREYRARIDWVRSQVEESRRL